MSTFFEMTCYRLWLAARLKNSYSFHKIFSRNVNNLKLLETASSKEIIMFLYAVKVFPPQKKQIWKLIEKYIEANPSVYSRSGLPGVVQSFSETRRGSRTFWNKVADLSEKWIHSFSIDEVVHIFYSMSKNRNRISSNFQIKDFENIIRPQISNLNLDSLVITITIFARVKYENSNLWNLLTKSWSDKIDILAKGQLIRLYWSYSRIQSLYKNPTIMQSLEQRIVQIIGSINKHQFLTIIYSSTLHQKVNPHLLEAFKKDLMNHISRVNLGYLAILSYSLAKLKIFNQEFYANFFDRWVYFMTEEKQTIRIRDLANTVWAIARVSETASRTENYEQFWKAVESYLLENEKLSECEIEALTTLIWSFRQVKRGSKYLWIKFRDLIPKKKNELDLKFFTIVLNTFAYNKEVNQEFLNFILERAKVLVNDKSLNHYYLSKMVRSLGKFSKEFGSDAEFKKLVTEKYLTLSKNQALTVPGDLVDYILGFVLLEVDDKILWVQLQESFKVLENQMNSKARESCRDRINANINKKPFSGSLFSKSKDKVENIA